MQSDDLSLDDTVPPQPDGKATGALVCGIIGLLIPLLAIPALILGFMSLKAANKTSAVLGIVFGFIGLLIVPLLLAVLAGMLVPAIGLVQQNAMMQQSSNNMRTLITGIQRHVADHGAAPASLAALDEAYPQEDYDRYFRSQAADDRPLPHYLYVRPSTELSTWQPVLLENPEHYGNTRLLLVTGDGRAERFRNLRAAQLWGAANILAETSRSENRPITLGDWQEHGVDLAAPGY